MSSTEREAKFTDFDAPLELDYRPLSRGALVSVPLALLSFLALLTPVFWFLPLVSTIGAGLALRSIARSEPKPTGRWLALTMFVLSVVLLGFAPARHLSARSLVVAQARNYAEGWLALLAENKLHEAHQLTLSVGERQPPGANLVEHYRQKLAEGGEQRRMMMEVVDPHNDFEMFRAADPVDKLLAAGNNLQATYRSASIAEGTDAKPVTVVELNYDVRLSASGESILPIMIAMEREVDHNSGQAHWRVRDVAKPE